MSTETENREKAMSGEKEIGILKVLQQILNDDLSESETKVVLACVVSAGRGSAPAKTDTAITPMEIAEITHLASSSERKARSSLRRKGIIIEVQPVPGTTHIRIPALAPAGDDLALILDGISEEPARSAPAGRGTSRSHPYETITGTPVRSYEEALLASALAGAGYVFDYERPFAKMIPEYKETHSADFTIRFDAPAGALARAGLPAYETRRIVIEFAGSKHRENHETTLQVKASALARAGIPCIIVRTIGEIPAVLEKIKTTIETANAPRFVPLYERPEFVAARNAKHATADALARAGVDHREHSELTEQIRNIRSLSESIRTAADGAVPALSTGDLKATLRSLSEVDSDAAMIRIAYRKLYETLLWHTDPALAAARAGDAAVAASSTRAAEAREDDIAAGLALLHASRRKEAEKAEIAEAEKAIKAIRSRYAQPVPVPVPLPVNENVNEELRSEFEAHEIDLIENGIDRDSHR